MAFLLSLYVDSFARSWWIAYSVQVLQWLLTVQGKGKQGQSQPLEVWMT